jgi:hypothetical protein
MLARDFMAPHTCPLLGLTLLRGSSHSQQPDLDTPIAVRPLRRQLGMPNANQCLATRPASAEHRCLSVNYDQNPLSVNYDQDPMAFS